MARETFQVATYQYYDWSSRNRGKTNLLLNGTRGERCGVWFEEDPGRDLAPAVKHRDGLYSLYYHYHQLEHLIDMLRFEKPIYVHFDDENGFNNSKISTLQEPVGEGIER